MNARKDRLRSLFGGETPDGSTDAANPAQPVVTEPPQKRSTSGAVKAMGLSLGSLSQEVEEARKLRDVLASGDQVIELDTALIERSPYVDRLSEGAQNDEDFEALKASIEEHGQQVPVLVRPHPDADKASRGLYQLAYGHRRAQAARELGRPVRAVVRALDDTALVMAQGKENAERRALSFIERAFFAKTLIDHGFDRATAQAALAIHKSEMSRLLQVAEGVPIHIVRAIGPAPKVGRPRWIMLGQLVGMDAGGLALQELRSEAFRAASSDARFQRLYARLERSALNRVLKAKPGPRQIADGRGRAIAELARTAKAARLTIPDSAGEGFADYIAARLPELHAAFRDADEAQNKDKN